MKNNNCMVLVIVLSISVFVLSNHLSQVDADIVKDDTRIPEKNKERFDEVSELHFIEKWSLESDPTDSTWSFHLIRAKEDVAGNLYLADLGNNRVMKVNPGGELGWTQGHAGHEPGNFLGLARIDTFGEHVFIHEGWNDRIQVLRNDGSFLYMFKIDGYHVSDFAAGPEKHVYLADLHAENLISVFDSDGGLIETFGERPINHTPDAKSHNNSFQVLFDVDTSGNTYLIVYAYRYPNPKLQKYNVSRYIEYEFELGHLFSRGGIRKLIVGKDNNVYVVSGDNQMVYSFNSNLTLRSKVNLSHLTKPDSYVFLQDVDSAGNLLITSFSSYGEISVSKLTLEVD